MSIEGLSTIASVGTFLVIAATAVAAFVQLRHMRGTNSIAALTECREVLESDRFRESLVFVSRRLPELIEDPEVRMRLLQRPLDGELTAISSVGNFFEGLGSYVRFGIIDKEISCALWSGIVVQTWERLAPSLAIMRRNAGPLLWEQFEYLAVISKGWMAQHPDGTYPARMEHLPVPDVWLDADKSSGRTRA